MKYFFFMFPSILGKSDLSIPIKLVDGQFVTVGLVDGQSIGNMLIDLNYPDMVVPICEKKEWAEADKHNPNRACYNPNTSTAFRYCDSDQQQCFDRMYPPLTCKRELPSSKWSLETSTLTEHTLNVGGVVTSIHAFEFSSEFQGYQVPMKGSISIDGGLIGLAPSRMSCRNETFILRWRYFEIDAKSLTFSNEAESRLHDTRWTVPYHVVPMNYSAVQGKFAFNMYSPKVCGADVLGSNVSSHWTAIVDLTQECLVIPKFMADNIHAWEGGDRSLMFKLDSTSVDWVSISLGKVCVRTFGTDDNADSTGQSPIVLGSSVVVDLSQSGAVVFETHEPFRIRFPTSGVKPTASCPVSRPTCRGEQMYYEPRNICVDPICDVFMLSVLDTEERVCLWRPVVPYLTYSLIIAYVLMEIFTYRLHIRALEVSRAACERSTGLTST